MTLLPETMRQTIPALYSQEAVEDPIARVKFFIPCRPFAGM